MVHFLFGWTWVKMGFWFSSSRYAHNFPICWNMYQHVFMLFNVNMVNTSCNVPRQTHSMALDTKSQELSPGMWAQMVSSLVTSDSLDWLVQELIFKTFVLSYLKIIERLKLRSILTRLKNRVNGLLFRSSLSHPTCDMLSTHHLQFNFKFNIMLYSNPHLPKSSVIDPFSQVRLLIDEELILRSGLGSASHQNHILSLMRPAQAKKKSILIHSLLRKMGHKVFQDRLGCPKGLTSLWNFSIVVIMISITDLSSRPTHQLNGYLYQNSSHCKWSWCTFLVEIKTNLIGEYPSLTPIPNTPFLPLFAHCNPERDCAEDGDNPPVGETPSKSQITKLSPLYAQVPGGLCIFPGQH
ncbi:putative signal peptide protein [Puccinia sorghi]|uniref:Putative signal peptide protein n=1 Tax=Puccinia sorghi TaxID=27349 RepID=A0A0L6VER8_9BASI|nr:putative signal peptide protein [Puccinia sorghi]